MNTQTITTRAWPCLSYQDARAAIDFLTTAFGFEAAAVCDEGGVVRHAELVWKGSGVAMLGQTRATDDRTCATGRNVVYLVAESADEVDALCERARAAGASILFEPNDQDYGSHDVTVADPEGNVWSFGTYAGAGAGHAG